MRHRLDDAKLLWRGHSRSYLPLVRVPGYRYFQFALQGRRGYYAICEVRLSTKMGFISDSGIGLRYIHHDKILLFFFAFSVPV